MQPLDLGSHRALHWGQRGLARSKWPLALRSLTGVYGRMTGFLLPSGFSSPRGALHRQNLTFISYARLADQC